MKWIFALDLLAHGCWLWFALVITFVSLFQAFLYGQQTLNGLADFMCRAAWGQMCAGLITVLIFSRFMGINDLWQCLLGKDFPRMAKNMVEEGTELFGYMLCFFSVKGYLHELRWNNQLLFPVTSDRSASGRSSS